MASRRERNFTLRKRLDLVTDHIDTALVGRVQLEHTFTVRRAEEGVGETVDRGRLADTGETLVGVSSWQRRG